MNKVVLDASIFVKFFKKEIDSDHAINLFNKLIQERVEILEPSVVVNETVTTCEVNRFPISEVCDFFSALIGTNIRLIELDGPIIQKTLSMTQEGHEKSGYPTFSDSVYHAIAIQEDALFITADNRHYKKTKHLGQIELLANLKSEF